MTATQCAERRPATAKAYRTKFKRPFQARAGNCVYVTAYMSILRRVGVATA